MKRLIRIDGRVNEETEIKQECAVKQRETEHDQLIVTDSWLAEQDPALVKKTGGHEECRQADAIGGDKKKRTDKQPRGCKWRIIS